MTPFTRGFADELIKEAISRRALARAAEMGLSRISKRMRTSLGKRWLWRKTAGAAKRQTTFDGLTIKIEYDAGDLRKGVNKKTGEPWEKRMHASYGYIPGTRGVDGEAVDVYLARHPVPGSPIFAVHQIKEDGSHDEDKIFLGTRTEAEAKALYLQHTPKQFFGSIKQMSRPEFDEYLKGNARTKDRRA